MSSIRRKTKISTTKKLIFLGAGTCAVAFVAGLIWFASGFEAPLGNLTADRQSSPSFCKDFSQEANSRFPGMAWVPGGEFTMGADYAYFEEGPVFKNRVEGFWMDVHEVTNTQFNEFVEETGYITLAERGNKDTSIPEQQRAPGAAVFIPFLKDGDLNNLAEVWWKFVDDANWRQPEGPGSSVSGRAHHPVVHVALEDVQAYAKWAGKELPTEAQFEFAAQSSTRKDMEGHYQANTWQGFFPLDNNGNDGYVGSSPVGCFEANKYGLYDLIGNVWEWTASTFYDTHDFSAKEKYAEGYDSTQLNEAVEVIKGGSFLCAPNYCMRYRPEARQGQSTTLGTSHIGFRLVLNTLEIE